MNLTEARRALEAKKSKRDELKGKKDFLIGRLKELGYTTIAKGKTALKKLQKESKDNQEEYDKKLKVFEKRWGKFL